MFCDLFLGCVAFANDSLFPRRDIGDFRGEPESMQRSLYGTRSEALHHGCAHAASANNGGFDISELVVYVPWKSQHEAFDGMGCLEACLSTALTKPLC